VIDRRVLRGSGAVDVSARTTARARRGFGFRAHLVHDLAMASPLDVFRDGALAGRVALITGGGTGICRGIAAAYARLGAEVCIVSRKQDVLDQTAAAIAGDTGRAVLGVAADVRDAAAVARAVQAAVERFGRLDTVVNGAAGNFLAPAAALSPNGFRTVIDIDLNGTFHTARAAFEALQRSGDGLILNISATLHYHGTPLQIHASAAKAGVDAITRNLAVEWGRFGIRVCGIAPGPIAETEGVRRLAPADATGKIASAIPAGRFGAIDEIAAAAVFLRSPAAGYITGHTLVVDGGHCIAHPPLGVAP
jgi:peroxisomal 2,4-dienoyl-CoA reductase